MLRKPGRDILERPVLKKPGKQKISGLEQRDIIGVDKLSLREQPHDFHIQEGGRDHKEFTCCIESSDTLEVFHIRQELVGDLTQRHLGDIEFAFTDEAEQ